MSKRFHFSVLLFAAISTIFLAAGSAKANLISDGGFEDGASFTNFINLSNGDTSLSPWSISGGNGSGALSWVNNNPSVATYLAGTEGNYFLDITRPDSGGWATITQSITTVAGTTYQLTFDIGASSHFAAVYVTASAGGTSQTFSNSTSLENAWVSEVLEFTATTTTTVISFTGASPGNAEYVGLDNVAVNLKSSPVPEPSSFALLGLGGIGLAIGAYRRRMVAA